MRGECEARDGRGEREMRMSNLDPAAHPERSLNRPESEAGNAEKLFGQYGAGHVLLTTTHENGAEVGPKNLENISVNFIVGKI